MTCCSQFRADNGIRKLAIERDDSEIIAVTSDERIAKEALHHFTCYRDYTRSANELQNQCIDRPNDNTSEVTKYLNNLRENRKYVELKVLQSLIKTESAKKNLKRTIETKTNGFNLTKCDKETLIYSYLWKTEDTVIELHKGKLKDKKFEKMDDRETIIFRSARMIKSKIKNLGYKMPWPPGPDDLNIFNLAIPTYLDSFLSVLLTGNLNVQSATARVNRLKLSFGQDLIYAGMYLLLGGIIFNSWKEMDK